MNFNLKNILLNFYLALQIFVVSMGLLCSSFSYAETDVLQAFQNSVKEDIPSDVEEVKNSVVKLRVKKKNGTGFILEDGLLVTNTHAVLNKSDSFANQINSDHLHLSQIKILQDGEFLDVQVTSIQALDMVHDLALLNIKGSEIPPAIKKPRRKVDLTKEELFLVGYPLGKLKAIGQKGPIEIFESKAHTEVHIPVSTKDTHGASGGPIVNQKGELMGVFHTASGNNIIFSNNDLLFSLQNAEYGVQCSKNKPIKDCFQQIEDFHLKEAEKGDAFVQYKLSFYFFMIDFNDKEGRKWLEQAAQQGFVLAQDALGFFLFKKLESYKEALKWFQLAAQQGNTHSAFQLGECTIMVRQYLKITKKLFNILSKQLKKEMMSLTIALGNMYLRMVKEYLKITKKLFNILSKPLKKDISMQYLN